MNKLFVAVFTIFSLNACATSLTSAGAQVRLVENQSDFNCNFLTTVTASNMLGLTTSHDAEGAMNELRNRAADLGANAIRVLNIDSDMDATTVVAEALNCQF